MGRSAATCFKIIACGSDSADRDEVEAPEVYTFILHVVKDLFFDVGFDWFHTSMFQIF